MDLERLKARIARTWDDSILERLIAYVRIPNKSPMFDPQWERNGHMESAVQLMAEWCLAQESRCYGCPDALRFCWSICPVSSRAALSSTVISTSSRSSAAGFPDSGR